MKKFENSIFSVLFREAVRKLSNKHLVREVKYFHPSGATLPNGSTYQRGGFYNECYKNINSFNLDEGVHGEQYGLSKYRGGIIVFAMNVNAVRISNGRFINTLKSFIETVKNRFNRGSIVHRTIMRFNNDSSRNSGERIGAYSLSNIFNGTYTSDGGKKFTDKSVCLEVNGLSSRSLLKLAEMVADRFKQETVLVKDLNKNKIYLVDSNESDDTFESDLNNKINTEC